MRIFPIEISEAFFLKSHVISKAEWMQDLYPLISKSLIAVQRKCDQKLIKRISENVRDTLIEHVRESQKLELMRQRVRDLHRK